MKAHFPVWCLCIPLLAQQNPATSRKIDPTYQLLRSAELAESFLVENVTWKRDAADFRLKSGKLRFLAAAGERRFMAVFQGEGEFELKPASAGEAAYAKRIVGSESIRDSFRTAVFAFTDGFYEEIQKQAKSGASDSSPSPVLKDFREKIRQRAETPRTLAESLFYGDDVDNLEAEILADHYNPSTGGFFRAYIRGERLKELRFILNPRGALVGLPSPEEVALVNLDLNETVDGILYHSHRISELNALNPADYRLGVDVEHYSIETRIDGRKLTAKAAITIAGTAAGERVVRFSLLPDLRVSRVSLDGSGDIPFIQEDKKADSAFHVVLPTLLAQGQKVKLNVEYAGDKVIESEGGGNFAVGARTSWYPSAGAFLDRATYDLTFSVAKKFVLVSIGRLVNESVVGDQRVSRWSSEHPVQVAGFNYGDLKKKAIVEEQTKYAIEGYAASQVPDFLRNPYANMPLPIGVARAESSEIGGLAPSRLLDTAMVDAVNSIRVFTQWFGPLPYGRLAVTQQPQMNFGQSWPSLVYLPVIAFLDSTQRLSILGTGAFGLLNFIQEVTPHEVAHQWWGHMVGWSSYRDQWLSEGLAHFSAGVFLQLTERKADKYLKYWDNARKAILEKNSFGQTANEAGPVYMGIRLSGKRNPGAYGRLVYSKGGYIMHMLRQMMWDQKTGDQKFIEMMKDFVKTHEHQNATSESLVAIVDKHMLPHMDLSGQKSMGWFFSQWLLGTEVPSYRLRYKVTPGDNNQVKVSCELTQSGVTDNFAMPVPIYVDFDGTPRQLGRATMTGSKTEKFEFMLPRQPKRVLVNAWHDVLAVENTSGPL